MLLKKIAALAFKALLIAAQRCGMSLSYKKVHVWGTPDTRSLPLHGTMLRIGAQYVPSSLKHLVRQADAYGAPIPA